MGSGRDWPLAELFGPTARVVRWPKEKWNNGDGSEHETKDANDLLQMMVATGGGNYAIE